MITVAAVAVALLEPSAPIATASPPATLPAPTAEAPELPGVADALIDLGFRGGTWNPRLIIQYDAALYRQDPAGPADSDFRRGTVGEPDEALRARDLNDGGFFRRVRLGAQGTRGRNFAYRADVELGGRGERGQARLAEVWLSYRGLKGFVLQAGAFPQPANAADAVRSASTLFLERPTAADLSRSLGAGDGRLGVTGRYAGKRWRAAVSLTGPVIDHAESFQPRGALVGRLSRTIRQDADLSLDIGVSGTLVLAAPSADGDAPGFPVRFRSAPEVKVDPSRLIDTGDIAANGVRVVGLELAAQRGSLYVLSEAFRFDVQREGQGGDPHFGGYYVEGSWVLTGEKRRFDAANGSYWFPNPDKPLGRGGIGAWELAFRYSRMDLNFHAGQAGEAPGLGAVRGGAQQILGVALKWYPSARTNLTINYLRTSVDRLNPAGAENPHPFGEPPSTPPVGVQIGQTLGIWALHGRYAY